MPKPSNPKPAEKPTQAPVTETPPEKPVKKKFVPPGKRPNDFNRRFDQTQLKSTTHGFTVHRDYAAHFFRWGFAFKRIEYQKTKILDLGCGQECPLARVLSFRLAAVPALWVGVDLNKIPKPFNSSWAAVKDEFSFIDRHAELIEEYGPRSFDMVTCFEMIEHMHPEDGLKLLKNAADLTRPGGEMLLSTPVYNGRKMAANHLHEYGIDELKDLILSSSDWKIKKRFGTFASWNDIKKVMNAEERELYDTLHEFYDHEVLACFLAPKYPDASRNNVWVLKRKDEDDE